MVSGTSHDQDLTHLDYGGGEHGVMSYALHPHELVYDQLEERLVRR